ncbi:uncharacterized protein RHOBADRAFT_46059 [Rhodotorula graminis WP1]|uniref:Uncharacterized protein n=1 Tax=Rhodotorula graminis (strain WP1) TaxID=578459 RepID=A0A0N8PZQ3_RHOGW|nr:uncharacterized protein RHOBADRAFT_46059 [Rhodotorula graminis WP1]KPV72965.1 hypothetical protein RHOBADRAFT_46059 [Rhodotorula graminis WP1]
MPVRLKRALDTDSPSPVVISDRSSRRSPRFFPPLDLALDPASALHRRISTLSAMQQDALRAARAHDPASASSAARSVQNPDRRENGVGGAAGDWWTPEALEAVRRQAAGGQAAATSAAGPIGSGRPSVPASVMPAFGHFPHATPFAFDGTSSNGAGGAAPGQSPPASFSSSSPARSSTHLYAPSAALSTTRTPLFQPLNPLSLPGPFAFNSQRGFYSNGSTYGTQSHTPVPVVPPGPSFFAPPSALQHDVVMPWDGSSAASGPGDAPGMERLSQEEKERIQMVAGRARRVSRAVEIKKPPAKEARLGSQSSSPSLASPPGLVAPGSKSERSLSPEVAPFAPRPASARLTAPDSKAPDDAHAPPAPTAPSSPVEPLSSPPTISTTSLSSSSSTSPADAATPPLAEPAIASPPPSSRSPSTAPSACSTTGARSALAQLDMYGSSDSEDESSSAESSGSYRTTRDPTSSDSRRGSTPDATVAPATPASPASERDGTRTPLNTPASAPPGEAETAVKLEEQVEADEERARRGPLADDMLVDVERDETTQVEEQGRVEERGKVEERGEVDERGRVEKDKVEESGEAEEQATGDAAHNEPVVDVDESASESPRTVADASAPSSPDGPPPAKKVRRKESSPEVVGLEGEGDEGIPEIDRAEYKTFLQHALTSTSSTTNPNALVPTSSSSRLSLPSANSPWPVFFPNSSFSAVASGPASGSFSGPSFPLQDGAIPSFNPAARPFVPTSSPSGYLVPVAAASQRTYEPTPSLPRDPAFQTVRSLLEDALGARGVLERKLDKFGEIHAADRKRVKELEAEVAQLDMRNRREGHAADDLSKTLSARVAELRAAEAARDKFRAERDSMRQELASTSSYQAQRNARTEQALKDEAARSKKLGEQVRSLEGRLSAADKARDAAVKNLEKHETAQAVATHALKDKVEAELGRAREEAAQSRLSEQAAKKDVKLAEAHLKEALRKCDELNAAKSALAYQLAQAVVGIKKRDEAVRKNEDEHAPLVALVDIREKKIAQLEADLGRNEQDQAMIALQLENAVTLLVDQEDLSRILQTQLDEARSQCDDLLTLGLDLVHAAQHGISNLRSSLLAETARADQAKTKHADLVAQAVPKIKAFQVELAQVRAQQGVRASQELQDAQIALSRAAKQLDEVKLARDTVDGEHAATRRALELEKRGVEVVQAKLDEANKVLEHEKLARTGVEGLFANKVKAKDAEVAELKTQLDAARVSSDKVRELEQVIVKLDGESKKVQQGHATTLADLGEAAKLLDSTLSELDKLKKDKEALEKELLDLKSKRGTAALGGRTFTSRLARPPAQV